MDVGRSPGEIAIALAKKFPTMKLVVQDVESTIDNHPPLLDNLIERVRFVAHDFFTRQPIKDADANA